LWLRLQTLFRREQIAQRLSDEIQFHIDRQIAENIAAGMKPEKARYAARRAFGNPTYSKKRREKRGAGCGSNNLPAIGAMPCGRSVDVKRALQQVGFLNGHRAS